MHCARSGAGLSTGLRRARGPPWLQRRIDFPIVPIVYRFVPSDYEQVYEFLGWRRLQALLIAAQPEDRLAPFLRKAAIQVPAEFLFEQGNAFVTAAVVAERIFYRHLERGGSVPEENLQLVSDRALFRVQIIARVALVLNAHHLRAQRVDARIGG